MTALVVLTVWFGLGCLTWALFAALVRGGRVDDPVPERRPEVDVPIPRAVFQPGRDRADSAT